MVVHFLDFFTGITDLGAVHLVGKGSRSLSELEVISLLWLIPPLLTAGCRGDFSLGEIGGWFVLALVVLSGVGDGTMDMDFGSERVFLRVRLSKSGEFSGTLLDGAGWSTGRPLMSETVVVVAGVATSDDCSNLEFEEHMIGEGIR